MVFVQFIRYTLESMEAHMNETIKDIPLNKLNPFPDHPFGVRDDEAMQQTVESVREYGVLVPAIARPLEDGSYELISGHRRKRASELAGLTTMPVIVRNVDRNTATIIMVDSNLQRENILPSERAKAYACVRHVPGSAFHVRHVYGDVGQSSGPFQQLRLCGDVLRYGIRGL